MSEENRAPADSHSASSGLAGRALQGGKWLGISAAVQALLKILIVAVLARLLTPAEFGLVAIAGIFIDLGSGVASMGVVQALVQRPQLSNLNIRAAFWLSMIIGIATSSVIFLSAGLLADLVRTPEVAPLIAVLSLTFILSAIGTVPEGIATRQRNFRLLALRQVLAYVVGYGVVGVGSALLGFGVWALVHAQLAQVGLASVLLLVAVRFDCRLTADLGAYREIIRYGSGVSASRIVTSFANQMDRVVVSIFTSPDAVGLYTKAVQVTRYPNMLFGKVIEDILFPTFAVVQADRQRLQSAYCKSVGSVCVIMAPVSVFFVLAAGPISDLLLGPQWAGVVPLMMILSVSLTFRMVQRVSNAMMFAIGRSWLIAAWQTGLFIATTAGALIGVQFGLVGVVVGVTIGYVICYVAGTVMSSIVLSVNVGLMVSRYLTGVPLAILAGFGAATGTSLSAGGHVSSVVGLAISVLATSILFIIAIALSPTFFLRKDGIWMLSLLIPRLRASGRMVRLLVWLCRTGNRPGE